MTPSATRFLLACLPVIGALLAGCGGDDGDTDAGAAEEIEAVLQRSYVDSTPQDCTEIYTVNLLEQLADTDDPVAECRQDYDPSADADWIEVSELTIDDATATVSVKSEGGALDGTSVDLALVNEDAWKIDQIEDLEVLDRAKWEQAVGETLKQFEGAELTSDQTTCLQRYVREEVSDDEIERSVVEGDTSFAFDAIRDCVGGGTDLLAIVAIAEGQLTAEGIPKRLATCIAGAGVAGLKDVTLEELATDAQANKRYQDALKKGAKRCG